MEQRALRVQLSVLLAQEEVITNAQAVLRDIIFSLFLPILLAQRHALVDPIQTLERKYVTLARLSVRHVQDRTAMNVKAALWGPILVGQIPAQLAQVNAPPVQEEAILSA